MKHLKKVFLTILIMNGLLLVFLYCAVKLNKENSAPLLSIRIIGNFNPSLLSHRLIKYDLDSGIVDKQNAAYAFGITSHYFKMVKSECNINAKAETIEFLTCANNILGQQFNYRPSRAVTSGWAHNHSDCDLNVYLLLDAMTLKGQTGYIFYAPGHAFLAYQDIKSKSYYFWETTDNSNTGKITSLLRDDLYIKNMHQFFYSPKTSSFAEKFYPTLVAADMDKEKQNLTISAMKDILPDNPMVMDNYYEAKETIDDDDVIAMKGQLQIDISSVTKNILIAKHHLSKGEVKEARNFISNIKDKRCDDDCLKIKTITNNSYKLLNFIKRAFKALDMDISLYDIKIYVVIFFVINALAIIFFPIFSKKPGT